MIEIREFRDSDQFFFFNLMSNPLVTENLPDTDKISSLKEAKEAIKQIIRDAINQQRFGRALIDKEKGHLIGALIANNRDTSQQSAFVAYELAPPYWGKGIMSGALKKFIPIIRKEWKLKKIYAQTTVFNKRSQRLLTKLGFSKEKEFSYPKTVNRHFVKAFLYKLDC